MPKLGDVQKMGIEQPIHVWGMWDGCFWSRVEWSNEHVAWLIPENVIGNMRDTYENGS